LQDENKYIEQAKKGNQKAFGWLVEKYQNYVFTLTFRMLKNRETAEEAAQDVFVKAYRHLGQFKGDAKFSTWLYQITYRTAIDYTRKQNKKTESMEDLPATQQIQSSADNPNEQLHKKQVRGYLEQLIKELSPTDASLITLYYLNQKSIKEIAGIAQLTESNVKVRLYRCRNTLKDKLFAFLKDETKDLL